MDFKKLVRNAEVVHGYLKELPDGSVITTKGCKLIIPQRFVEIGLATIEEDISTVAIFAIVVEDRTYAVTCLPTMFRLEPSVINTIKDGDKSYIEFYFEPGATVFSSTELIQQDTIGYDIYNELIAKGKIPWYLAYDDMLRVFEHSKEFSGVRVGANDAVCEMVVSVIYRQADDPFKYYRHVVQNLRRDDKNIATVIPLKNVAYGATNTAAKLIGSYFSEGLNSALINPSERLEKVEELLRR